MSPRWGVIVAEVPDALADEIAFVLGRDGLGVELGLAAPSTTRLKVYWARASREPPSASRRRPAPCAPSGSTPTACALRSEGVEDGRWVERYQATLQAPSPRRRSWSFPGTPARAGRTPRRAGGPGDGVRNRGARDDAPLRCGLERLVSPGSALARPRDRQRHPRDDLPAVRCGAGARRRRRPRGGRGRPEGFEVKRPRGRRGARRVDRRPRGLRFRRRSPRTSTRRSSCATRGTSRRPCVREGCSSPPGSSRTLSRDPRGFAAAGLRIRATGAEGPWALVEAERVRSAVPARFLILGFAALACACSGEGPARGVLFITLDTTRADRLGAYGYLPPGTPNLDALAARGVRFDAGAVDRADHPPRARLDVHRALPARSRRPLQRHLPPRRTTATTLAEVLKGAGFATAGRARGLPGRRRRRGSRRGSTVTRTCSPGRTGRAFPTPPQRSAADVSRLGEAWLREHATGSILPLAALLRSPRPLRAARPRGTSGSASARTTARSPTSTTRSAACCARSPRWALLDEDLSSSPATTARGWGITASRRTRTSFTSRRCACR